LVTDDFYVLKREQYQEERKNQTKSREGFVTPAVDTISVSGKPFTRIVLGAYHADRITLGDVSDYLGVKSKHLKKIGDSLGI